MDDTDRTTIGEDTARVAASILADSAPNRPHRPMVETPMSCGHRLIMRVDEPDGSVKWCPLCDADVTIQRKAPR